MHILGIASRTPTHTKSPIACPITGTCRLWDTLKHNVLCQIGGCDSSGAMPADAWSSVLFAAVKIGIF